MIECMSPVRTTAWLALLMLSDTANAVQIDGVMNEAEWAGAQHFDHFVAVQPLTGKATPADRGAEAWLKSTPEGIAAAIRVRHPSGVPQTRTRIQRDGNEAVDRVNFMLDFDADGQVAYYFSITAAGDIMDQVISNENSFNADWDGAWQHAVSDTDDGYLAEWLIPWSTAQMRDSSAARRTISVYFDEVIAASGERFAYPEASFTRPRFVSDFAHIDIEQFQQNQLSVTPYAVAMRDQVGGDSQFKTGVDVFWKPSGDHQFALTINPDFGQVESDELVVNFSNIETYYSDKRQFFTENQSYFDLKHHLGTLFYTRRVGGAADDGSGSSDIRVAVKGNGGLGQLSYGVFAAQEDGAAGRNFSLLRTTYDAGALDVGLSHSRVDHPLLDRHADVTALDARWQPSDQWLIRPLLMQSDSTTAGLGRHGHAAGVVIDWDMPGPWRQQYFVDYTGRDFELNDLGYQSRNNSHYYEWETGYRQDELPQDSVFASHDWEFELASTQTTTGLLLRRTLMVQRSSQLRDGSSMIGIFRWRQRAWDDRIGRGNGAVPTQNGAQLYLAGERPRRGDGRWALNWSINAFPNPISGYNVIAYLQPQWNINDHFNVDVGLSTARQSDWLIWQQGQEFGSFRSQTAELYSDMNWFIDDKQELRIKLQAIAIDADAKRARRLDDTGRLVNSDASLANFQVRNLGFQIRYRYKLAALSDIYAVYSRGGYRLDRDPLGVAGPSLNDTLADAFSLADDDQFFLKIAYRFDL